MRKTVFKVFIILLILTFSLSLASCEAITAQNITHGSSTGMGANPGMNNRPMNGNTGTNNQPPANSNRQNNSRPAMNNNQGQKK